VEKGLNSPTILGVGELMSPRLIHWFLHQSPADYVLRRRTKRVGMPWSDSGGDAMRALHARLPSRRPLQTHCHLGLDKLYGKVDLYDEARAELSTAVAMLRDMGMAYWLPEAENELAAVNK
jgi:hypothetical protein